MVKTPKPVAHPETISIMLCCVARGLHMIVQTVLCFHQWPEDKLLSRFALVMFTKQMLELLQIIM